MRRTRYVDEDLDGVDILILEALVSDGRIPLNKLAARAGLSSPSTAERVRRLEEAGVIEGYGAHLNYSALGLPLAAMIRIRPMPGELAKVAELLAAEPRIVECDRVTGEDCFVAKAFVGSVADLEKIIDALLPFATTSTSIIQSSPVKRRMPAIPSSKP